MDKVRRVLVSVLPWLALRALGQGRESPGHEAELLSPVPSYLGTGAAQRPFVPMSWSVDTMGIHRELPTQPTN